MTGSDNDEDDTVTVITTLLTRTRSEGLDMSILHAMGERRTAIVRWMVTQGRAPGNGHRMGQLGPFKSVRAPP